MSKDDGSSAIGRLTAGHTKVFRPVSSHDLLAFYTDNPGSRIFAGGTSVMLEKPENEFISMNDAGHSALKYIIDCSDLNEFKKIKRTERFLEIGAFVSLSRMLGIGSHVIPQALTAAISLTATSSIRNMATIGGNIITGSPYSNILTVLYAMDCSLELRSLQKSYWVSLSELLLKNYQQETWLPDGYILSRIHIPLDEWSFQVFRKIARKKSQRYCSLTFCGLIKTGKGVISDIRICFGSTGNNLFRNRGFEVGMLGRKLPIHDKEIDQLVKELSLLFQPETDRYSTAEYRKSAGTGLFRWFLAELNQMYF